MQAEWRSASKLDAAPGEPFGGPLFWSLSILAAPPPPTLLTESSDLILIAHLSSTWLSQAPKPTHPYVVYAFEPQLGRAQ